MEHPLDVDQRAMLLGGLAKLGDKAEEYLKVVERERSAFLCQKKRSSRASPAAARKELERWIALAVELEIAVFTRDSLDAQAAFMEAKFVHPVPIDFFESFDTQLSSFREHVGFVVRALPKPRAGRPPLDCEIGLIAQVAIECERLTGQLPCAGRGSWFCHFVEALFSTLPVPDAEDMPDRYRLVAQAMKRIRMVRGEREQSV